LTGLRVTQLVTRKSDHRLFGCHHNWINRDILSALFAFVERHATFGESEQRVISATTDITTRPDASAALTDKDVASKRMLAAEFLHAKAATR
jgi:hypothetical protein